MIEWEDIRNLAVAIAADRIRRGVLTTQEVADAIDESYQQGLKEGRSCSTCPVQKADQ
jgi:ribosome modulation factor